MSGSREKFGVVTERRVMLVMASYDISNVTFGSFCSAVAGLVREQIIEIDSYNVIRYNCLVIGMIVVSALKTLFSKAIKNQLYHLKFVT